MMSAVQNGLGSTADRSAVALGARPVLIVARDRADLYNCLRLQYAKSQAIEVMIDRRVADRRQRDEGCMIDRRRAQRRAPAPATAVHRAITTV